MKKAMVTPEGVTLVDLTSEEIAQDEIKAQNAETEKQARIDAEKAKADLKASAKAKLIAGEALTEDEANELVGL